MNQISSSPFLHRESRHSVVYRQSHRSMQAQSDLAKSKLTLEKLRYRWWVRRGTLGFFMQPLGDFGRKFFGWMDPRQTGGGWW